MAVYNELTIYWKRAPALFFGLLFTLSFLVGLGNFACSFPLVTLFLTGPKKRLSFLFILLTLLYAFFAFSFPKKSFHTTCEVEFSAVKKGFKKGFLYSGQTESSIPISFYSPTWIDPSFNYLVDGQLKPGKTLTYTLKTKKSLLPIQKVKNFATSRFLAKERVKEYLVKVIPQKEAYLLLTAFATGCIEEPLLAKTFEQAGLSHLLAISGFHFAFIALFFFLLARLFLPPKASSVVTLLLLTLYFFFLGPSASVSRAWIASLILLLGKVIERRPSSLNSLGGGLLIAFLFDPLSSTSLGFQLSFLATGAIFIVFPEVDALFSQLFPEEEKISSHWLSRCLHSVCRPIRQALSLNLAVHLALLPLLLYTFHKFALHSLAYNLFFPTLFSISLFLLPLATLLHFVLPPVGAALHFVNGAYTDFLLSMLSFRPSPHYSIYSTNLSSTMVAISITAIFLFSLISRTRREENLNSSYNIESSKMAKEKPFKIMDEA